MRKYTALSFLRSYGTVLAGAVLIVVFSILRPAAFATMNNFINITRQISLLVLIALGATIVMSVEEFDLSVGAMASFAGVVAAKMAVAGAPLPLCFFLPVIISFILGYVNGAIVTGFRVLSFITTLAMGTVLGGFTFWFTGGSTVFQNIPKGFSYVGTTSYLGVPLLSIIMFVFTIMLWFVMSHTTFGRRLYAIGGNEAASLVSGINVRFNKNMAFAICGAMAALTGVLMASRLGSAHPTGGEGLFLQSYAAAFLGKTAFMNGVPNIWGTFVGAAILGILANGLTILQVPTYMQDLLTGIIIISAVVFQKIGRDQR